MLEEPENGLLKLHREEKLESTAQVLIEKEDVPDKDGDKNKWWQGGVNITLGEVGRAVCEVDRCDIGQHKFSASSANTMTDRFDKNKNITDKRSDSASFVPDDDDKKVEDRAKELLVNGQSYSYARENIKHQACDTAMLEDAELSNDQLSKLQNSVNGSINSKQKSKESVNGQINQETEAEKVATSRSYALGYFTGKLSEAYKDAGRRLQGTRDIIQNIQAGEIKVVLSQYVTMMSKELPLIHRMQRKPVPEPCILPKNKVRFVDLSKDCALNLPPNCGMSAIPGVSGWPEGSLLTVCQEHMS